MQEKSVTTPPNKYPQFLDTPTAHLIAELSHRLKADPSNTYEIWPDGFLQLKFDIIEARHARD
jgi:hypothetical protein